MLANDSGVFFGRLYIKGNIVGTARFEFTLVASLVFFEVCFDIIIADRHFFVGNGIETRLDVSEAEELVLLLIHHFSHPGGRIHGLSDHSYHLALEAILNDFLALVHPVIRK